MSVVFLYFAKYTALPIVFPLMILKNVSEEHLSCFSCQKEDRCDSSSRKIFP